LQEESGEEEENRVMILPKLGNMWESQLSPSKDDGNSKK
jgi:hypothetical protein